MKLYVSSGVNPYQIDEGDVVTEWGEYGWYCKDEVDETIARLESELAEAVKMLKRVTKELNRFHLNEKQWIGNPFECPICRMIESAMNVIKRQEAKHESAV